MDICSALKEKTIIIAENQVELEQKAITVLQKYGLEHFEFAVDKGDIYGTLRPYFLHPHQIGLLIVNEDILISGSGEPDISFCFDKIGLFIPTIILSQNRSNRFVGNNNDLVYILDCEYSERDLEMVIDFLLIMKQERITRYQQDEKLINELAKAQVKENHHRHLLFRDELTGLANRRTLESHLKKFLGEHHNRQAEGCLLFIDIDKFSFINELEGFDVGDQLVIEVAATIRNTLTEEHPFSRLSSDDFCLFLANKSKTEVNEIAEKIRYEMENFSYIIRETAYNVTVSIGIAPLNASKTLDHPDDLISRAHQACLMAKENGRNRVWVFNEQEKVIKNRNLDVYWVPLIKQALLNDRFFLVFQPVVSLDHGLISHYEVLLRMRGEDGETISPSEFILAAERMGLIHSIDSWVVETAINYLASLPESKGKISLAINLSSVAFLDMALLPRIKQQLEFTGVSADRITFEITETAAIENYDQMKKMIKKIRALGCRFALDDFGAGFCSFNYLKWFPVDYVKIDGQFIQNLEKDETDQVLVRSMVEVARNLGKRTIAEFVESPGVVRLLQEIGVDLGQGYIFGKPECNILENERINFCNIVSEQKLI